MLFKKDTYYKLNKTVRFISGLFVAFCFIADFLCVGSLEYTESITAGSIIKIVVFSVGMFVSFYIWDIFGGNKYLPFDDRRKRV